MRKLIGGGLLLATAFVIAWSAFIYATAPVEALRGAVDYHPPYRDFVRQAGLSKQDNVTLKEMPIDLILATLVGEDLRFAYHRGVRWDLVYIVLRNYLLYNADLWSGKNPAPGVTDPGDSTITQQLVKNVFVGSARNLYRKYKEVIYAEKMERTYSKAEIFTLYASIAETGPGLYGYRDAARVYFHKEVRALTPVEDAFIVSILTSPVRLTEGFQAGKGVNDFVAARMVSVLTRTMELKALLPPSSYANNEAKQHLFSYMQSHPEWLPPLLALMYKHAHPQWTPPGNGISAFGGVDDAKITQSAQAMVDAFVRAHGQ